MSIRPRHIYLFFWIPLFSKIVWLKNVFSNKISNKYDKANIVPLVVPKKFNLL